MHNCTYASVKVSKDCEEYNCRNVPLLKKNFLSEFKTELDKKKVLDNLGVIDFLSLEWKYVKPKDQE